MKPKFVIQLSHEAFTDPFVVMSDGTLSSSPIEKCFAEALQFDDGRHAELFAEAYHAGIRCTVVYCGIGFQESLANS